MACPCVAKLRATLFLSAAPDGREAGEIVFSFKQLRRLGHMLNVQRKGIVPNKPAQKRRADRRLENPIAVSLRADVVAGVKLGGNFLGILNAHRRRES